MHVRIANPRTGIVNQRFPLKLVAGKTFPAFPAHAHPKFYLSGKRPIKMYSDSVLLFASLYIFISIIMSFVKVFLEICGVRTRSLSLNLLKLYTPYLTGEDDIWALFCEFKVQYSC